MVEQFHATFMRMEVCIMNVFKKIMVHLIILSIVMALIITLTGFPIDLGVITYDGNSIIDIGFDESLDFVKQNFKFVFSGEIFKTTIKSEPITDILKDAAVKSLIVLFFGTILALVIGIFKGILDSRKTATGGTLKLLQSLIPLSLPDILMIALVQFAAMYLYKNNIPIPGLGIVPYLGDDSYINVIFPVLSICILPAAYISRVVANAIEEGLTEPYILAARGKGCSLWQIIRTHLSRNIAYAILSNLPALMGMMFSSLVIVETFYQYKGIGYRLIDFYTTTLIPSEVANNAFTFFMLAMAIFYYFIFEVLKYLKQAVIPNEKST